MPVKTTESPPPQGDRDREPGSGSRGTLRNIETQTGDRARNDYAAFAGTELDMPDDPEINTHGSER
jgi:hypothetical protein